MEPVKTKRSWVVEFGPAIIIIGCALIAVACMVCDPQPLPAQYVVPHPDNMMYEPPPNYDLIDSSVSFLPPPEYKVIADSLFVLENPVNLYVWEGQSYSKRWCFVGIVIPADTVIVRYEGETTERYWR
ncbi:MAG: hypothetical protein C4542_08025 [Dehalococcoidia bacterium]|nr:MAG: hypothetical protein C4542_08025 [Dehalococcoidia bacterium]